MIEPGNNFCDGLNRLSVRQRGTLEQNHWQTQRARSGDLAVAGAAAAVLGDNDIDVVACQQSPIIGLAERTARGEIDGVGNRKRRLDRIDAPHQIDMLGRGGKRLDFFAAHGEKHAARDLSQRLDGLGHISDFDPLVAVGLGPSDTAQRQQRNFGAQSGANGIDGDDGGVRMRGVDQRLDTLLAEILLETFRTTKATNARRDSLAQRIGRAASKRQGNGEFSAPGQRTGKSPRFRRTAENEDLHGAS